MCIVLCALVGCAHTCSRPVRATSTQLPGCHAAGEAEVVKKELIEKMVLQGHFGVEAELQKRCRITFFRNATKYLTKQYRTRWVVGGWWVARCVALCGLRGAASHTGEMHGSRTHDCVCRTAVHPAHLLGIIMCHASCAPSTPAYLPACCPQRHPAHT